MKNIQVVKNLLVLSLENVCGVVYNFSLLDLMPKNGSVFIQQQLREKQSSSRKSEKQVWGVENMKRPLQCLKNHSKSLILQLFTYLNFIHPAKNS